MAVVSVFIVALVGCAASTPAKNLTLISTSVDASGVVAADGDVILFFDRYLDPTSDFRRGIVLKSGDVELPSSVAYDPVLRAVLLQPGLEFRPRLGYSITLVDARIAGIDGARLGADLSIDFVATLAKGDEKKPSPGWAQVEPILKRSCGCHGGPRPVYPELSPEALIGQPSVRQPGQLLVVPGRPLQSYLVLRILRDYPGVLGLPMPVDDWLADEDAQALVSWVQGLR